MARRGRPPGSDSEQTRRRIIDAARVEFAERGYGSASISSIASTVGVAPSALYHYFSGKADLYETVYLETAGPIWTGFREVVANGRTLREIVVALMVAGRSVGEIQPVHSDFMALVPMEARLHPEFAHLLDRRTKYQDEAFTALAQRGIETGELSRFDVETATEILRAAVMGWFLERKFRTDGLPGGDEALLALLDALAD